MKKKIIKREDSAFQELLEGLEKIKNQRFSSDQRAAIQYGYSIGADVEHYVAQSLGIDTTPFENPAFSYDQMHELLMGLREKLDVSVCANINFKSQHMSCLGFVG